MIRSAKMFALAATACCLTAIPAAAQNFQPPLNTTIQLPTVRLFNIRTAVSVPDGGTMSLGGVSSYSSGQTSRGIPGLRGPLFQNRTSGYSAGGSHASVKVRIISSREIGEDLLAEGNRLASIQELSDPNGTRAVQARADFLSRNIGRSRR